MNSFSQCVEKAINNIRKALISGYDIEADFLEETNYSEICEWCKFPDYQTSTSAYEKAINIAILVLAISKNANQKSIDGFVKMNTDLFEKPAKW